MDAEKKFRLKKLYFDTYIQKLLMEPEVEANEKRILALDERIKGLKIKNSELRSELKGLKDQAACSNDDNDETDYEDFATSAPASGDMAERNKIWDISERRLYVRNLNRVTTVNTLIKYFDEYGKVEDVSLPLNKDRSTNRTYAFITFAGFKTFPVGRKHEIDGRKVRVTKLDPNNSPQLTKYLLANGILNSLSENDLKVYFSKYGTVVKVMKEKSRGRNYRVRFAYIQFLSCNSVEQAIKQTVHEIRGQIVDIRKVNDSEIKF